MLQGAKPFATRLPPTRVVDACSPPRFFNIKPKLDGTAVAECWGGEVGVMADGCILLMPAGGRLLGGPPTKGDHHVAITCADDRGHDAGRVGPRDAAGLHPGGTPIGCALPAFAGPAQRGRGAGLPALLAPGRGSPWHVQDQPVRAAFPLLPYACPRVGVVRGKKGSPHRGR